MAGRRRTLEIQITGDARKAREATGDVQKGVGKISGAAKKAAAALGGLYVADKAKEFLSTAVSGAREAIQIDKQTKAVLKSTGNAAGVSFESIEKLANKLQKTQVVSDEVTQSGANLLLTFTNIRNEAGKGNDIFDQTVELANDMSVALGQDMKASSIQLGKALNDPVRGVSALQEVGVSFTESQREQIAAMVEAGDVLGAQKVILGELETQFGGSAAAQADDAKRLSLAWADFQEVIGRALIPILDKLMRKFTEITQWATENPEKMKAIGIVVGVVLVAAFAAWAASAAAAAAATIAATWPVLAIGAAIAALAAGLIWAYNNVDWFREAVQAVAAFLKDTAWPILQTVAKYIANDVANAVKFGADIFTNVLLPAIKWVVGFLAGEFQRIKDFITGPVANGVKIAKGHFDTMLNTARGVRDGILSAFNTVVSVVTGMPGRIANAASSMFDGIKNAFRNAINFIIGGWNRISFSTPTISIPGFDPPGPGPSFGGVTVSGRTFRVPQIPYLHSGGIFESGSPRGEGFAYLEDGEGVFTPAQMRAMGGRGTTVVINVHGSVYGDRRALMGELTQAVRDGLPKPW